MRRSHQLQNLKRYGLTEQDYQDLLEVQEFSCAICYTEETRVRADGSDQLMAIDHCHRTEKETGKIVIRGLLCANCNTALGLFKDDIEVMRRAIEYLGG